jgi:chromatin segregation and condensation protein Rec8/ScpA/Scc1 (kleisin family)
MKNLSNKVLVQLVSYPITARWYEYRDELLRRLEELDKYRAFFESCSCLYAEGAEFMTKTEIYEVIKKEVKRLESSEPRPV